MRTMTQENPQLYWSRRHAWPLRDRFRIEFAPVVNHLTRFKVAYLAGGALFLLAVACVILFKNELQIGDFPIALLASAIHLLRLIAIISLFFAWLSAKFIKDWLYEKGTSKWTQRHAAANPNQNFTIPHWRFFVPTFIAQLALFTAWLVSVYWFAFTLPAEWSDLDRLIPSNFPI